MTEGTIKTSKYEIIAIFREELRKRTEIEIFFNNTSIITQLTRVDFAEFHIQTHRKIPSGHKIRFLLHSDSGKIEFNAALTKHDNSGVDKGIRYAFSLPECLQVVQRRRDPRFRLRHEHDFYCRGRHKNGENYLFDIKDISDGGCALMTKTPNLKFLSHNALLKNAVLMLAEYGEITIDLVVKNVIVITLDNANEESESYYQISCQFKFRHLDDQRRTANCRREDCANSFHHGSVRSSNCSLPTIIISVLPPCSALLIKRFIATASISCKNWVLIIPAL